MKLSEFLGVELPVIQASMAGAAIAPLRAKAEAQGSGDFFATVMRTECQRLQGNTGCATHAGTGGQSINTVHAAIDGLRANHGRAFSSCAPSRNSVASSP